MAIALSGTSRVDFSPLFTSAKANFTVALTVKVNALPSALVRLITCWGDDGTTEEAFAMSAGNAGVGDTRLYMAIKTASGAIDVQQTGLGAIANGGTARIVSRFAGGSVAQFWVNGTQLSTTTLFSTGIPASAGASNKNVQVGQESDEAIDALDADYAEVAIWYEAVPDWVAIDYGKGMSPKMYRSNGALYCPLVNTSYLVNQWDAGTGTNTGGTDAPHPAMYYPG